MKKIYLILASALLCAAAAQAQDAPAIVSGVTFSVAGEKQAVDEDGNPIENSFVLPSVDDVVQIELQDYNPDFDSVGNWQPYIVWTMGTGFAIDQAFEKPVEVTADTYTFTLNKEKWGNPSIGNYYVTVMVCFVQLDEDGEVVDMLYGADEEPVMFDVSYVTPNEFPAELQYVYPDNSWADETFAEAYENGVITFGFTNPVNFSNENDAVTIAYTVDGEDDERTLAKSACVMEWNRLDGFYTVSFNYSTEDYTVEEISKITISLNGVMSVPESGTPTAIVVKPQELVKPTANPAPHKQKSRMAEDLTNTNEIVNVYNVQGMLVKESVKKSAINELPAGLYIVNGKKIVVR